MKRYKQRQKYGQRASKKHRGGPVPDETDRELDRIARSKMKALESMMEERAGADRLREKLDAVIEALKGHDIDVVVTDWREFKELLAMAHRSRRVREEGALIDDQGPTVDPPPAMFESDF